MVRRQIPRITGACVVAAIVLVYATTFVVHEGEGALVETFGRAGRELKSPGDAGVHLVWPWPIQKVRRYDLRERLYRGDLVEVSTADRQLLVVGPFCLWKVADLARFRSAVAGEEGRAEGLIAGPMLDASSDAFARHRFAELVDAGAADGPKALGEIEREIASAVAADLDRYGIDVEEVGFYQLLLPARATEGVFVQMREAEQRDAARLETIGKGRAAEIRARAARDYEEGLLEARKEAGEMVAAARAEAAKMVSAAADSELLVFLEELEVLKELFSSSTTIVFDPAMPPLDTLLEARGGDRPREAPGSGEAKREGGGDR